jgi:hypothetical protein
MASHAVGAASGFVVSAFTAVESEISLQYGGVHELLIPFLPLTDSGSARPSCYSRMITDELTLQPANSG